MNTLIISSSLSKTSRSFILCNQIHLLLQDKNINTELVDAREMELLPFHKGSTPSMEELTEKIAKADNIIFGMGVHCYSVNDGLKIILDGCCEQTEGKFFGIVLLVAKPFISLAILIEASTVLANFLSPSLGL